MEKDTTSFPGSSLFLPRGRKREDPGNEVGILGRKIMSRVEVCSLAYEGKFNELKGKIDLTPSLATKVDEVRFYSIVFFYNFLAILVVNSVYAAT